MEDGAMKPTLTRQDWRNVADDIGAKLAEVAITGKRPVTDAEANILLEGAGTRLCEAMLGHGVPEPTIEATLDALAVAFEARLKALEQAMLNPAGRG